jgi:hypothetical protein
MDDTRISGQRVDRDQRLGANSPLLFLPRAPQALRVAHFQKIAERLDPFRLVRADTFPRHAAAVTAGLR